MSAPVSTRYMSELDHARIRRLLPIQGMPASLSELVDGAELLPPYKMPSRVVTMNSRLLLEDPATGEQRQVTLCYPMDADAGRGMWSVLSPAGAALLGLAEGELASWIAPDGRRHALRLQRILYQPESCGDYLL
jgi:regulator of nucleoside diphosphate kinase